LSELFHLHGAGLRCVVLSACYTDDQAAAIAAHVPCVVGTRCPDIDDTGVLFAKAFYRGITREQSIRTAFDVARDSLDDDVAQLFARAGA
jgi:hypothetical protein